MTIDRIEYTGSFQLNEGYWFKVFWGGQITPDEDPETETLKLKERIEELAKKFGSAKQIDIGEALYIPVVQVEKPEDKRIGVFAKDILSCNDIKTLETYKLLVKNKPKLQEAYDKRLAELSNQKT